MYPNAIYDNHLKTIFDFRQMNEYSRSTLRCLWAPDGGFSLSFLR